ncbi:MAG: hypothetical protein RR202_10480 [Bacteroidales bacterium]
MDLRTIKKAEKAIAQYNEACEKLSEKAQRYIDWGEVECEHDDNNGIIISVAFSEFEAPIKMPVEQFFIDAEYLGSLNEVECRSISI